MSIAKVPLRWWDWCMPEGNRINRKIKRKGIKRKYGVMQVLISSIKKVHTKSLILKTLLDKLQLEKDYILNSICKKVC